MSKTLGVKIVSTDAGKATGQRAPRESLTDWITFSDDELTEAWTLIAQFINKMLDTRQFTYGVNNKTGEHYLSLKWKNFFTSARKELYTTNNLDEEKLKPIQRTKNIPVPVFKLKNGKQFIIDDLLFAKNSEGKHGFEIIDEFVKENPAYTRFFVMRPTFKKFKITQRDGTTRDVRDVLFDMRIYLAGDKAKGTEEDAEEEGADKSPEDDDAEELEED